MKSVRTWLALLMVVTVVASPASMGAQEEEPSNFTRFAQGPDAWLEEGSEFVERGLIPSVLVMVETPEWGLRVGTVGNADLAESIAPTPSMRYRVGGMTKLMLTTIVLQLEQERKLSLSQTVDELLGEGLVRKGYEITLRDCLNMQSGLFDYATTDRLKSSERSGDAGYIPEEILHAVRKQLADKSSDPGKAYSYSETGYLLAGMVVERVAQKPLTELVSDRILVPLNMRDSFFAVAPEMPAPCARGYESMSGVPKDCTEYDPSTLGAANAVVSTPFDTFKYMRELLTGTNLLTRRSGAMMAGLANAEHHEDSYGLGLMERTSLRGTWRGFESSIRGYSVVAGYYAQGDALVAVFINTDDNKFAMDEIFRNVLRRVSGCPTVMSPANGEKMSALRGKPTLTWQAGLLYGDSYNVFCGTDEKDVLAASAEKHDGVKMITTKGTEFEATPSDLTAGSTYYWKVDLVRSRPDREMENARKYRDLLRKSHPEMPLLPVPESETIPGPVYSFSFR